MAIDEANHNEPELQFRQNLEKEMDLQLNDFLQNTFTNNNFTTLHYYWGNHEERASIRLTGIFLPPDSYLKTDPQFKELSNEIHKSAFSKHVSILGSRNTLLRWLYLSAIKKYNQLVAQQQEGTTISIEEQRKRRYFKVRFEILDDNTSPMLARIENDGNYDLLVKCNRVLIDILWPSRITNTHRRRIYSDHSNMDRKQLFVLLQGDAMGRFHNNSDEENTCDCMQTDCDCLDVAAQSGRVFNAEDTDGNNAHAFIRALQTGIGYITLTLPEDELELNSFDFFAFLGSNTDDPGGIMPSVTSLFSLGNNPITNTQLMDIRKFLENMSLATENRVRNIKDIIPIANYFLSDKARKRVYKKGSGVRLDWELGQRYMNNTFPFRQLGKWHSCLIYWLCSLITQLRGSVHEGKRLGFRFACGDLSEIENNSNVKLEKIGHLESSDLTIPLPTDKSIQQEMSEKVLEKYKKPIRKQLKIAADNIAKQNYSWFEDSKYALFWDITFPNPYPCGLLRLNHGDWDWYIREFTIEESEDLRPKFHLPALVLAYVNPTGKGAVLVDNHKVMGLSDRKNRQKVLTYWLNQQLGKHHDFCQNRAMATSDELIELIELLVRIADDPDSGCCLVFVKDNTNPNDLFIKMGRELKFSDSINISNEFRDELIHLLPTDGATCVWFNTEDNKWNIDFKFLLQVSPESSGFEELRMAANTGHQCSLRGCGSRRWSGGITALHDDVRLIIVVSQDGDILAFRKGNNNILEQGISFANGTGEKIFTPVCQIVENGE